MTQRDRKTLKSADDDHETPDDSVSYHETLEGAIAEAMIDAKQGEQIVIHDGECEIDDDFDGCTCEPLIVTVNRGAA